MITDTVRTVKRAVRKRISNAAWGYLMKDGRSGWGRRPFDEEELKLLRDALVSQNLCCINGVMVPAFERAFATLHDVPYAVASTSGTAAIHVALGALDLNPGDEVITAPITDLGTIIPILSQGGIPVFADIDATGNIDPADVERKVTPRTKAILAVHLFGNPCDMNGLKTVAARHRLVIIEDCSQAHLAEYQERLVGTIGDIGCFSFQQSKHMTTGDGGMTLTANRRYYERMKLFADKGYARKGYGPRAYLFHAPNYRMTELVGAVGIAQLRKLPSVVARRRELGEYMAERLARVPGIGTLPQTAGTMHSYWLYPAVLEPGIDLEAVGRRLAQQAVNAMAGYTGKPIYLCSESLTRKKTYGTSEWPFSCAPPGVSYEYAEGLCPRAEQMLEHLLCLPFDESWTRADVDRVAAAIDRSLSGTTVVVRAQPSQEASQPILPGGPMPPRIRVGIVGCGQMGRWHLDAYKKNPRVELVAFADANLPNAAAFAGETGTRAYRSHLEMLTAEQIDALSVCTIPATHQAIAIDALRSGRHVLCEKPLATSVEEALAMCDAAAHAGRLLVPAFKFRFFDEVRKAKELLDSGVLGAILKARLMFGGHIDMAGSWYSQPAASGGGVLMDNGPHAFDLIRWLLGEMTTITAISATYQSIPVEDTASLSCDLACGGTATIDLSWSMAVPSPNYLEIYGEQGAVLLAPAGVTYKLRSWSDWKQVANGATVHDAFARQIDHFVAAASGTGTAIVGLDDALQSQLLIDAAYRSIERSHAINLLDEAYDHGTVPGGEPNETADVR